MSKRILIITGDGGESFETGLPSNASRKRATSPTSRRHPSGGCIS